MTTVPKLPKGIERDDTEHGRLYYNKSQLLEYGLARAEAGYSEGYRVAQADKAPPKSDDVSKLFRAFGMKP